VRTSSNPDRVWRRITLRKETKPTKAHKDWLVLLMTGLLTPPLSSINILS
jgi:hypothetical protein